MGKENDLFLIKSLLDAHSEIQNLEKRILENGKRLL